MSGTLKIRFTSDMPPAAVEVVAPDLSTVGRVSLAPGEEKDVDVPSEGSFLRVHLPSGEIVTLQDPGSLDRTVDVKDILARRGRAMAQPFTFKTARSRRDVKRFMAFAPLSFTAPGEPLSRAVLDGGIQVVLNARSGAPKFGSMENGAIVFKQEHLDFDPYELILQRADTTLTVRLPGSASEIAVRSDFLNDGRLIASVRVKTTDPTADAIAAYMHRGDLYSASSMSDWAEKAEDLLGYKLRDPFAAMVGAYLLLRLRRLDLLHDWTNNLKDYFPLLTDPKIIRAWHLIYAKRDETTIRQLFTEALEEELPVFTEGFRLLSEGVRLLGNDSDTAVQKLNDRARRALSRSPFTTTVQRRSTESEPAFDVDIDYASQV